ncbi:glomulin-like isoform X2 [Genypterus blacodes]|uniref:glomulin-like isoform X2 n=1 Tax=Genypterus blacodes TaxID=154954 RepID=UPI003F76C76B
MNVDQMNDIIQTWRETPEEDLTPQDYQQFTHFGQACLAQDESEKLLKFLQNDRNQGIVKSMGCGLLASLTNEVVEKRRSRDHCQAALTHLTKTCSPEQLLHSLLEIIEDIDPSSISETIVVVAPLLQTVLLEGQTASVGSALVALQKQMSRLPVPYTRQQEAADEHGLCRCCATLAAFIRPFVEEVKRKDGIGGEEEELKAELLKFCMRSLKEPLLGAQLDRGRTDSPLWLFAAEIVVTLHAIQKPLYDFLLINVLKKSTQMDNSQFNESRASLAYLTFVQFITIDQFPAVFSPVFLLQCNMDSVSLLLSSKNESYILKGLALHAKSMEIVQDSSLPVGLLELKAFSTGLQSLQKVLTDCPLKHLREAGLQVFQLFIDKLDAEAKHKFFRWMLKTSNHSGVDGYIIKNIRNEVDRAIKLGNTSEWFQGAEFVTLLGTALCLPQGAETDLLHSMDRIMESLNLLRFLLITNNEVRSSTDGWIELCRIKDQYLKMLRVCISMSRAYYTAELKSLRENQKLKAKEARDAARSTKLVKIMRVKHDSESQMAPEVQHQVLQSALVTFDLMESLIFRIEEIAKEKQKAID